MQTQVSPNSVQLEGKPLDVTRRTDEYAKQLAEQRDHARMNAEAHEADAAEHRRVECAAQAALDSLGQSAQR